MSLFHDSLVLSQGEQLYFRECPPIHHLLSVCGEICQENATIFPLFLAMAAHDIVSLDESLLLILSLGVSER